MSAFGRVQITPITTDGIVGLLEKEGGIFIALIEQIQAHIIGPPLLPLEVAIFDLELESIGVPIAQQVADQFTCSFGAKDTFRLVKGYHLLDKQAIELVRDCVAREYIHNLNDVLGQLFKILMELEEIESASIM